MAPSKNDKSAAGINGQVAGFGLLLELTRGCAFTQPTSNCLVRGDRRMLRELSRAISRVRDAEEGRDGPHVD